MDSVGSINLSDYDDDAASTVLSPIVAPYIAHIVHRVIHFHRFENILFIESYRGVQGQTDIK